MIISAWCAELFGENVFYSIVNYFPEPDLYGHHPGWSVISPTRMSEDYAMLQRVIAMYPAFNKSILVGPDTGGVSDYYNTLVDC